jgi:hypothetical protein
MEYFYGFRSYGKDIFARHGIAQEIGDEECLLGMGDGDIDDSRRG